MPVTATNIGGVVLGTPTIVPLTAAAAFGSLVVVRVAWPTTGNTAGAVADSRGNTYTELVAVPSTFSYPGVAIYAAHLTTALTTSDTITVTSTGGSGTPATIAIADCFTSTSAIAYGENSSGTSSGTTTPTLDTSTGVVENDVVLGAIAWQSTAVGVTDPSWNTLMHLADTFDGDATLGGFWEQAPSTGTVAFQPVLTSSVQQSLAVVAFKVSSTGIGLSMLV